MIFARSLLQNLIRSCTISLSRVVVIGSRGYDQYDLLERGNVQLSSEVLLWYPYYSSTKSVFLSHYFKYFPLILRFRLIRIFSVLEYSVYSAFQKIQYFPCFRIFHVFRILEYCLCSAIPFRRSVIPPNRVTQFVGERSTK